MYMTGKYSYKKDLAIQHVPPQLGPLVQAALTNRVEQLG